MSVQETIVVFDHNETSMQLFGKYLEDSDYRICPVLLDDLTEGGETPEEFTRRNKPDVILCNLSHHEMRRQLTILGKMVNNGLPPQEPAQQIREVITTTNIKLLKTYLPPASPSPWQILEIPLIDIDMLLDAVEGQRSNISEEQPHVRGERGF